MAESELYKQFYGPNAGLVIDLYERFCADPNSVDPSTRAAFETWNPLRESEAGSKFASAPRVAQTASGQEGRAALQSSDVMKVVMAARVARLVREIGHLTALIDPLGSKP